VSSQAASGVARDSDWVPTARWAGRGSMRVSRLAAEGDTSTDQRAEVHIAAHRSAASYPERGVVTPSTIVRNAVAEIFSGSNASPARFITPFTT